MKSASFLVKYTSRETRGNGTELSGKGQPGVREWLSSREWWAWNGLPRSAGTALSAGAPLSDKGVGFWVVLFGAGCWT